MRQIVATLGIQRIVFTQPYRPMGHGKVEALNRFIRSAFLAELAASPQITTLDALNEAFIAWADTEYNRSVHSETGVFPLDRWRVDIDRVTYADEEKLRQAFLWREKRTPDKTGVFSLFGRRYQTSARLARQRIEVRYDPEALEEVEVWLNDCYQERVRPFEVQTHRRPRDPGIVPASTESSNEPEANWLGHLTEKRRRGPERFDEPIPRGSEKLGDRASWQAEDDDQELKR